MNRSDYYDNDSTNVSSTAPLSSSNQASTAIHPLSRGGERTDSRKPTPTPLHASEKRNGGSSHASTHSHPHDHHHRAGAADGQPPMSRDTRRGDAPNVLIQWDFVEREVSRTVAAWDAVSDFVLHLLLLIMFCFYFFPDVNPTNAFALRRAIHAPLVTGRATSAVANFKVAAFYHDIASAAQYTDYVLNSLLPNLYDITYPTGSPLLVGGVRLRTQRVVGNRCNLNQEVFHAEKGGVLLATSSSFTAGNILGQSCFGDLGSGGGSANLVGARLGPRSNELTPLSVSAGAANILPRMAGYLWLLLSSNWLNMPVDTAEMSDENHTTSDAKDGNSISGSSATGFLWRHATCEALRGRAKVTWGVAGELGSYHCGGFYFDVPFWQPTRSTTTTSNSSTRDEDSEGQEVSANARAEAPMNDPHLVSLPYYSPAWERVSLRNASRYVRARLVEAGGSFLDDIATRFAATEFYVYQPSLGMFASVRLYAEVVSGGAWVPRTSLYAFRLWTRQDAGKGAYNIVFFIVVVVLLVRMVLVTLRRLYHQASRKLVDALLLCNMWLWLDVSVFLLLLVSGSFRIVYLVRCAQLHVNLPTLTYAARYPAELDSVICYARIQVYLNAVVTVLLFARATRYLGYFFTPLIFVGQVLLAARATLIGVALLLLLGITTFTLTAHVLLNESVAYFGTVDRSFRFFFYLLLRQVDVEKVLRQAPRQTETVFLLWSFLLLVGLAIVVCAVGILLAAIQAVGADAKLSVRRRPPSAEGDGSDGRAGEQRRLRDAVMPSTVRWFLSRYVVGTLLHPSRYKVVLTHEWKGRGRAALLHRALRALRSYRRLLYSVRTTVQDVDSDVISEEQFMRAVLFHAGAGGEQAGEAAAAAASVPDASDPFVVFFYEEVWAHLCDEWATSMTSKEAVEMQRRVVWATAAVEHVVGGRMDILQHLPRRLASLEASVTQFVNVLNEIPLASAV